MGRIHPLLWLPHPIYASICTKFCPIPASIPFSYLPSHATCSCDSLAGKGRKTQAYSQLRIGKVGKSELPLPTKPLSEMISVNLLKESALALPMVQKQ